MVILYVKGKKAAKLGSRAENCGEDMSGRLLSSDFLQSALLERCFHSVAIFVMNAGVVGLHWQESGRGIAFPMHARGYPDPSVRLPILEFCRTSSWISSARGMDNGLFHKETSHTISLVLW